MKLNKLCSAALLAALAAATFAPAAASASATEYTSEGKITFKQGNKPPGGVTDPEEGEEIDKPGGNPNTGTLMIIGATPYTFGDSAGEESTSALATYNAQAFEKEVAGVATGEYTPHFVEFRDIRTNDYSATGRKYYISGQVTTPFTNGGSVLNGAKIKYSNAAVQSQKVDDGTGTLTEPYNMGVAGTDYTLDSSFTLSQNAKGAGDSVQFLAHTGDEGFGRFHVVFGDNTAAGEDDNVQLEVPANQVIVNGEYTAEVTWTISETPQP